MARIAETFNLGSKENLSTEKLLEIIETMYTDLAIAINRKPDVIERADDGQTTDTFLSNGDININTSSAKVEILTSHTSPTAVVWTQIS